MASSALAATRARIAQLGAEMEKLQRLMDSLLAEREKCHQTLADYKYPILTLPAEITSEIFLQFLPSYPERSRVIGPHSPSFLLQICRQWRDVALTTPALWSTVELILRVDSSRYHAQQLDLLKMWLQRSGNCSLSVLLESIIGVDDDRTIVEECIDALLCHASRWQDMEIILSPEGLRKIAGSMPLLHSLTIGMESREERPKTPVALFTDAPALKRVLLYGSFDPFLVALPWFQITTLRAEALYAKEAIEILRHATMLEDCSLDILSNDSPEPSTASSIPPLPLRSLRLQSVGAFTDEMHQLFKALRLPVLQTLSVREDFLGPDPVATLAAVCRNGYPHEIEVIRPRTSRESYAGAFPLASFTFDFD
ncbi:hypothetical protein FB45DRAFT_522992 [Roridomyces roridus]|uniref:F-box domain-containing protein n=1 Tax=Roridomyces roridus TaxID=1738132 RepID=A0AAD7BXG9_9AGAR|nr:hypothetical protein FB45DRAFT_522992 [Roridomyces roridus]